MAIQTEERIETKTYTHTTKLTCDLCGAVAPRPYDPWVNYEGDVDRVTMSYKKGSHWFNDGGDIKEELFDICPNCWKTKVVPWLKSQGATPRQDESSW